MQNKPSGPADIVYACERREEIKQLLSMSEREVQEKAGKHLLVQEDCAGIHRALALEMADFIAGQNAAGKTSKLIVPVGPIDQYPLFLEYVHQRQISLKNTFFFFMDEYADTQGKVLSQEHPLAFKKSMYDLWLQKLDDKLAPPEDHIIFPSEKNIHTIARQIEELGGIDVCFGGIGIHGHVAFNEPEAGVRGSGPRLVSLNLITVTINAVRAKIGGNIACFPRTAYTLGMQQILGAHRIRLACRNGIDLDWANAVLRVTLLGRQGDDFPSTYISTHPDYLIYTDKHTLRCPEVLIG